MEEAALGWRSRQPTAPLYDLRPMPVAQAAYMSYAYSTGGLYELCLSPITYHLFGARSHDMGV